MKMRGAPEVALLGIRLMVAVTAMVTLTVAAGCTSQAGSDLPPATLTSGSESAATGPVSPGTPSATSAPQLSAAETALALAAAHQDADRVAVGRTGRQVSGWPSGISSVVATARPGTVADSNTGQLCRSGRIIAVRMAGAFDTVTTGSTDDPDPTVREIDLSVDATTGLTCLISVRTEPLPAGPGDTVLFQR